VIAVIAGTFIGVTLWVLTVAGIVWLRDWEKRDE